ncbi:anhydro-N-acetylmuramic acid kinase [Winogradskyella pacifica]|uniref:Anhydro-N-acetylmuramic acid kinase n=1 Tax=Winogradskyella pacifica TaxID=664642 RepID=A0A3D9LPY3_9FLAO|nr:anhydro-N-acetylmuramic acid kinase [Winogradskyella pacifica]REE08756.1 anhydro-N-acetylmuramic acid kinase [Winogradskyella pacifica]
MAKYNYNIIAVMSGTSLDGIDLIYATYNVDNKWSFKVHYAETIKYSPQWKTVLGGLVNQSMDHLQAIDAKYSEYLATVISSFIKKHSIEAIDFISSHGHTALHQPEQGLTYQIGNQQILADMLNRNVICDFRVEDVELGGQGAPLVPIGDRLLFNDFEYCLNLGGFANISFESKNERIAYDICPVNIVLNHYVSKLNLEFDDKGQLASAGKVNKSLLLQLNALHYYKEEPPKSLGLEWVDLNIFPLIESFQLEMKDILRTFVEHVALQISKVLVEKNTKVLVTGGGVYNNFLIDRLRQLSIVEIVIPQNEIIEFKEALIFGLLGVLKKRNEINCLKSVTGAKRNHSSGKILIPKNRI